MFGSANVANKSETTTINEIDITRKIEETTRNREMTDANVSFIGDEENVERTTTRGGKDESKTITTEESSYLFKWNAGLAALHLLTGVVICIITDRGSTAPVYTFFPDPDTRGIPKDWAPVADKQWDSMIGYFAGLSLLLAGLDHLLVATVFRSTYEWYLARNRNPFRWVEYAFSASFMHVMIAQLSGVFSIHTQFAIFGFTFVTMIFGNEQEVLNAGNRNGDSVIWRPFMTGWIPHMFGWLIILCFFFQAVTNGDPPAFVWAIIFIIFALDVTFPINMYLQQSKTSKWSNYVYGEIVFCVLSLTSKQLLAWMNYGGTNALKSNENATRF